MPNSLTAEVRRLGRLELKDLRKRRRIPGIFYNQDHDKGFLYLSFLKKDIERERQKGPGFFSRVYYITVNGGMTQKSATFRGLPIPLTSMTWRGEADNICFQEFIPG